jgi:hypothetical protein
VQHFRIQMHEGRFEFDDARLHAREFRFQPHRADARRQHLHGLEQLRFGVQLPARFIACITCIACSVRSHAEHRIPQSQLVIERPGCQPDMVIAVMEHRIETVLEPCGIGYRRQYPAHGTAPQLTEKSGVRQNACIGVQADLLVPRKSCCTWQRSVARYFSLLATMSRKLANTAVAASVL